MQEGQSVQDHLRCMKEITDKLAALGSTLEGEEQFVSLLISLLSSYATLVTALKAKGDNLSLVFVKQALANEQQRGRASKGGATIQSYQDSALQVDQESPRVFKCRCYKCNKEGHKTYECRESKQTRFNKPAKKFDDAKAANEEEDKDSGSEVLFLTTEKQEKEASHN